MPRKRKEELNWAVSALEREMNLNSGDLDLGSSSAGSRSRHYSIMLGGTEVFSGTFATRTEAIGAINGATKAVRTYKRRQTRRR